MQQPQREDGETVNAISACLDPTHRVAPGLARRDSTKVSDAGSHGYSSAAVCHQLFPDTTVLGRLLFAVDWSATDAGEGVVVQSILFVIESQTNCITRCLDLDRRDAIRGDMRAALQRQFTRWVHRRLAGSVCNASGCPSCYLDEVVLNRAAWPGSNPSCWRRMRHLNPAHVNLTAAEDREPQAQYQGEATITAGADRIPVTVTLSGHVEHPTLSSAGGR